MSEQNTIPAEMLDAATYCWMRLQGYSFDAIDWKRMQASRSWKYGEECTRKILEAANVPALVEDAATFRHLLNIAQQVYGFEMIGDAFTKINNLHADVKLLRDGIEEWRKWIMSLSINQHCSRLSTAKANVEQQAARVAELEAANIKLRAEIEVLETENAALEDELSEYSQ